MIRPFAGPSAKRAATGLTVAMLVSLLPFTARPAAAYPGANGKIDPSGTALILVDPDGANRTAIPIDDVNMLGPNWSPDGRRIALSIIGPHPAYELYVMEADGSGLTTSPYASVPCREGIVSISNNYWDTPSNRPVVS